MSNRSNIILLKATIDRPETVFNVYETISSHSSEYFSASMYLGSGEMYVSILNPSTQFLSLIKDRNSLNVDAVASVDFIPDAITSLPKIVFVDRIKDVTIRKMTIAVGGRPMRLGNHALVYVEMADPVHNLYLKVADKYGNGLYSSEWMVLRGKADKGSFILTTDYRYPVRAPRTCPSPRTPVEVVRTSLFGEHITYIGCYDASAKLRQLILISYDL